jgi:hypothetical protein
MSPSYRHGLSVGKDELGGAAEQRAQLARLTKVRDVLAVYAREPKRPG